MSTTISPNRPTISAHEVRCYLTLLDGAWRTAEELGQLAGVARRTAHAHLVHFKEQGLVEFARVFPHHRYRLLARPGPQGSAYCRLLREAAQAMDMPWPAE